MGSGLNSSVTAIALSGGDIYAGGLFTDAGGNPSADKIARWDVSSRSALGGGLSSFVNVITASGANLYVGGNFLNAGGDADADYTVRWDGSSWSALGATPLNARATVTAIAINELDLYAEAGLPMAASSPANSTRSTRPHRRPAA
jgi:hypothetical protein